MECKLTSPSDMIQEEESFFFKLINAENVKEIEKMLNPNSKKLNSSNEMSENINESNTNDSNNDIICDKNIIKIWEFRNPGNDNFTVLHHATFIDNIDIVKLIIEYSKKYLSQKEFKEFVNAKDNKEMIPIHYAFYRGNISIIKFLIENDADINIKTKMNINIVHISSQGNEPNSLYYIKYFTKLGFEDKDNNGSTPLHWAAYTGAEKAALYLLSFGVDINNQDNDGNTPLHLAVMRHNKRMVTKLLQYGSDVKIRNKNDQTPRDLAIKKNLLNLGQILKHSEGNCHPCAFKAPLRKVNKSCTNIFIIFLMQFLTGFILITGIFPKILKTNFPIEKFIPQNFFHYYLMFFYLIITLVFFILDLYLINSNPGRFKIKDGENHLIKLLLNGKNLKEYCPICKVNIMNDTKHCIICNKCCKDFDHHCYWVNNCIGKKNFCAFYFFLIIALLDLIHILGCSIYSLFLKSDEKNLCNDIKYLIFDFPLCAEIFINNDILVIFGVVIIVLSLFFIVPIILLIVIHTKNIIYNRNLMKKLKIKNQKAIASINEITTTDEPAEESFKSFI